MKFVTAYGSHDASKFGKSFDEPSLTHQSMSDACDINNIMKRYEKTGMLEHVAQHNGDYGDFTDAEDYHASLLKVSEAQEMFASLPAQIRARFENEPANFLSFVDDPANRSEMARMGLLTEEATLEALRAAEPPVPSSEAARSEA